MFSRFFIERPVFAAVVSIIIVLAGLVAMRALPIEQYPTIIPVQVTVQTTYPGADSQTLAESVAAPIEAQINGVDNMLYMTSSSSSTGQLTLTVFFSLDTDPDIAQVQVQNRVNLALPQLPEAVTQNGVQVQKKSSSIMMLIAVKGPAERYTPEYIANYANVYVLDTLKRVPGAGQAQIFGVPDQAMRIWMNPDRMASLGITTSDIQQAVQSQNALFGAGQIGQQPTQAPVELSFPVVTQRPFTDPLQYENMILRAASSGSAIVRLKDVARAEVGLKSYIVDSKLNGVPATYIAVYQQAGSNAIGVSDGVRKSLAGMQATLPPGIETVIALDTTDFVRLSIEEVIHTLFEALVLVVVVVFLFLQSLRATFICVVAIGVALVGAFTGMYALGYSLNLLTLFGLVLAIGMVVDDAIVVVENTDRNMNEHGLSPKDAAIRSMEEVSGPVIAVVLVLCAVFIPAAFLPGSTGQLYKQFAITIVASVAISGFVALTLTPAMCALLLKHEPPKTKGFFGWFNRQFQKLTDAYGRLVMLTIRRAVIALILLAGFIAAIVWLFKTTPTSFVPLEDQGYVLTAIVMPDAASLDRTVKMGDAVDKLYAEQPGVLNRSVINGYSLIDQGFKTNASTLFVTLKDFKERYKSIETAKLENPRTILIDVYKKSFALNEALVLPIAPPAIPGLGTTGGFEFWIQSVGSGDVTQLDTVTQEFIKRAKARPELAGVNTTFRASSQQLKVDVDRDKATLLGVQISDVYSAIQAQFGSLIVSQFNQFSRSWFVILQSDARFRLTPDDITKLYTRNQHGQMIPLTALVKTSYVTGPDLLPHFNGFPAAKIIGSQAPGFSSGQAIAAMEDIARELPGGYRFGWSGIAYDEKQSGGTSMVAFAFGLIFVFLVLAAQYESWTLPGAVMTAVPFGVLGALVFNWMRGLDNDVYFQIGLLVLIGLGAKNAVLRVSAAVELRRQGKSIMDATMLAGEQRLRPIVMTSLAFAFGVLPLALALGAGANARHSIGTGIIGGMLGETTLAMLYVPLFYYLFARF
ncbi:MAG TPA: multidrug efflux RND transporter permease subunit, partial [Burkholderiaceae bacterium]|nr:multidrug efflux RND transporter permease subunit [Burkholderiaceae bacterium]